MQAPRGRRIEAKSFGEHVTADHVISNYETYGFQGEWNALVIKDVFTQVCCFYCSAPQGANSLVDAFMHYMKPDDAFVFYIPQMPGNCSSC